ncbi:MAG: MarR family transcriptional regulator [Candidatus Altiarchaeales archaeon]|nr:MarR family transcriptional regulator [Candidatus Altiarchaeales archaeon]MBD3415775.1 MarR family transcriptional regulator [Candidatus Altiarchaeales archaeon]
MPHRSKEEYLETIYGLLEDGKEAKTGEIARELGVKESSVSEMLRKLDRKGLIRHKPYQGVRLTKKGLRIGENVKRKHRLLERFLCDVLKIRKSRVHDQACQMEHSLSDEAADALDRFMDYPGECPDDHKPIPPGKRKDRSLINVLEGETVTLKRLDGGSRFQEKMMTLGLMEGKRVKVVAREPLGGPLVVKTGNTRVSIGRGMASKVKVI